MPALPPVPGVVKIKHIFSIAGDTDVLVNWHYKYTGGPPSDTDCANLADTILGSMNTNLAPLLSGQRHITGCAVIDLSSSTGSQGLVSENTAGTRSGSELGAGTAFLVSMPIARRYRGGKPRSYWPFGTSTDLTSDNRWDSTILSAALTLLTDHQTAIDGLTEGTTVLEQLCSISYYSGFTSVLNPVTGRTRDVPKVRTGAIPVDPILAFVPSAKLASQRRRNQQRG